MKKNLHVKVGSNLYAVDRKLKYTIELTVTKVNTSDCNFEVIAEDCVGNAYSFYAEDFDRTVFQSEKQARFTADLLLAS